MLHLPNCKAFERLVVARNEVTLRLESASLDRWPEIIDTFVEGLTQLHSSALPIVHFVLIDLHHHVDHVVTERLQLHCDFSRDVDHAGDCTPPEDLCAGYSSTSMLQGLPNVREADFDLADRFALYVRAHLSQRLTASCIAVSLGCLPVRLATVVRARLHHTVRAHIRQQRLEAAVVLIRAGDKIESVIIGVGYRNRTSFFRDFRERFGMLPSEAKESREPSARCA